MLNVLVAEDDLMIADMIEDCLISAGYQVCGIARTVPEAVRFGQQHRPDLAIIDMKLADGGLGTEIVSQLADGPRMGVLYATGNSALIGAQAEGDAYIAKPYLNADLMRALKLVEQIVNDGFATPPFPRGFALLKAANNGPCGLRLAAKDRNMFTSIRKYNLRRDSAEELARRVQEGFVPMMRQMQGFRGYYLLDGGPDVLITISMFDSADEAFASNEKAAKWVRNNVLEFTKGMPEVMIGNALIAEAK
jgi:CheY-like chemotaxis protein